MPESANPAAGNIATTPAKIKPNFVSSGLSLANAVKSVRAEENFSNHFVIVGKMNLPKPINESPNFERALRNRPLSERFSLSYSLCKLPTNVS